MRFEGCTIIQIVELPQNGKNKYAVRYLGSLEYFDYDFMCKNSLKKFFKESNYDDGKYIILHINENRGQTYIIDSICTYKKGSVELAQPGESWKKLVAEVLEEYPYIKQGLQISTSNKVDIPKIQIK